MRIVRFVDESSEVRWGFDVTKGTAALLEGSLFGDLRPTGRRVGIRKLLAPLSPPNIYGIGLNYREHARKMGAEIPDVPVLFMKPTTTITNPGDPIRLPKCCTKGPEVDYECELGVVIGKTARDVREEDALDYVFGYTAANELSARLWAKVTRTRGKCFDSFCPIGPAVVTTEEIPDPQNLDLVTTLNGKVMQSGNTADMIFSVAELISFVSQDTTLLPGTLILTGTPPGSGITHNPPVYLQNGDQVQVEIENIGQLSNPVVSEVSIHDEAAA